MVNSIVPKINVARIFSVLAEETTDTSYFFKFIPVTSLTGESLAQTLLDNLINLGIDCSFMVGQGYDEAAAMSGNFNNIQAHVAIYIHCASNSLNLAISDACELQNKTTCSTALQLLSAIQNIEFQIFLRTTTKIFGITSPLSRLLQIENLDLSNAITITTNIEEILLKIRNFSEKEFNYIFKAVKKTCSSLIGILILKYHEKLVNKFFHYPNSKRFVRSQTNFDKLSMSFAIKKN
ncbi:Hypothetical protein CINCED_3A020014 [Cinara cedri]|uniref:DUF4371 domain-containing protein n=1 Tax=Cinara cedri TaxID=506608 RepID=A0A5E4NN15_9HEMI|nr:Hypothetical protein CINCED_3A020014 [Cinara cedri]